MATYGNSIYQYQDPSQVDISVLAKAVQFKQQNYDVNTMNTQNLVNQYLNMDIAREEDKEYFAERIGALVNYVNSSGQKDWSRTKVATDINNYIGNAIDENVTRAVASTKLKRKQDLEIEELAKNKPELVNQVNVWHAQRDWERYMTSGKVGDMYKPNAYVPYVDVHKRVTELAPKLIKDFGVDIVYDEVGGNMYFKNIHKKEVVTKEEAEKFVNLVLGEDGKAQIAMNTEYGYRDHSYKDLKKVFDSKYSAKINSTEKEIESLKARRGGAKEADKKIIDHNISVLNESLTEMKNVLGTKFSRQSMAYDIGMSNFTSAWASALSYDKTIERTIDDTGFQWLKFEKDMEQRKIENQLSRDKFDRGAYEFDTTYNLDVQKAIAEGKITMVDGKPVANFGGPSDGLTTLPGETVHKDEEGFHFDDADRAYKDAYTLASDKIQNMLDDPTLRATLEKEYGPLKGLNADTIAWHLIGKGGIDSSKARLSNLIKSKSITQEAVDAIRDAQDKYPAWVESNKNYQRVAKEIEYYTKESFKQGAGKNNYTTNDTYIDENGDTKVVGIFDKNLNYYSKLNKKWEDLTPYQKIGYELATINQMKRENNEPEFTTFLNKRRNELISKLPKDKQQKALDAYTTRGYVGGLKDAVVEGVSAWGNLFKHGFNMLYNNKEDAIKNLKDHNRNIHNSKVGFRDYTAELFDAVNPNYDSNDIYQANTKVIKDKNGSNIRFSEYFKKRIAEPIKTSYNNLQKYKYVKDSNITVAVDTSVKGNEDILRLAKAYFPTDDIPKNASISFSINKETNEADLLVPVTRGKETTLQSITVPINSMPQRLLSKIDLGAKTASYDASLPTAQTYTWEPEILNTEKEVMAKYGSVYEDPKSANIFSKEELIERASKIVGTDKLEKYESKIKEIINSEIKAKAIPVQGTYILETEVGEKVYRTPLKQNISSDIDLIGTQVDKIVSEAIIEQIVKLTNKK